MGAVFECISIKWNLTPFYLQIMVDKAMTVSRSKVGASFGRIDADAMIEVERCLAVFLGIAK